MHISRRTVLAAAAVAALPSAIQADEHSPLRQFIEVWLNGKDGDSSVISVSIDVPDYNIHGLTAFSDADRAARRERDRRYRHHEFVIETIATTGEWELAYTRLVGTTHDGVTEDTAVFYAARVADGWITELYF